ncbi:helix-turn-helix domain-containing protein [Amycolatopsis jiangsuensis]|uniref:Transcriptional regulator with XRE-family HTH domain n=1 Tax=Amycolatopsis jiangsuensis TaxID=1181879 RepID=A0A840J7P0_9PSEU|nr:helix-turn-helix transcriptional regulator [Amycolatopsis jiangsuensis]MBB4689793.1 transcriptional regulator with XRE-family HTH domain [Amycolatopsis jiangsuensis]
MGESEYAEGSLGWWIDFRRSQLGLTLVELAERAGMSRETLRNAAQGRRMRAANKRRLEDALQWQAGAIDAIARGADPAGLVGPAPIRRADGSVDAVTAVRTLLDLATSLRAAGDDAEAEETLEMATRLARRQGVLAQLADEITAAGA